MHDGSVVDHFDEHFQKEQWGEEDVKISEINRTVIFRGGSKDL